MEYLYIVLGFLVGLLCGLQNNKERLEQLKYMSKLHKKYIEYLESL
jgi:hypothetical protein